MDQLEYVLSIIAIIIVLVPLIYNFTNRVTRLETKLDCLLSWVIEIDPTSNLDTLQMKHKRDILRKQIENQLNGNGCKPK